MSNVALRPKDQPVSDFTDTLFDVPEIPRNGSQQTRHLNDLRDAVIKAAQLEGYAIGMEQGHAEGFGIGTVEGKAEAMILAEREREVMLSKFKLELASIAEQARAAVPAWCEIAERELTVRVADICRRILMRELELDRSTIMDIVREAMKEVTHSRVARLRVNPLDAHVVMQFHSELLAASRTVESVEVIADPTIAGGCVIETGGGAVGAGIETQLEVVLGRVTEEAA